MSHSLFLYWENSANSRYYQIIFEQDLLQDWVLIKLWGRHGTRLGRQQKIVCESYQQGLTLIETVKKTRQRHGYQLVKTRVFLHLATKTHYC
jgi:predicted DNA-binding WGR domain protein